MRGLEVISPVDGSVEVGVGFGQIRAHKLDALHVQVRRAVQQRGIKLSGFQINLQKPDLCSVSKTKISTRQLCAHQVGTCQVGFAKISA